MNNSKPFGAKSQLIRGNLQNVLLTLLLFLSVVLHIHEQIRNNLNNLYVFQSKTRKGGGGHGPDGFEGYDAAGGKVRMEPSWWKGKQIFDDFCMWG